MGTHKVLLCETVSCTSTLHYDLVSFYRDILCMDSIALKQRISYCHSSLARLTKVTESSGTSGRTYALKFIRQEGAVRSTHTSIVAVVHTTGT